VDNVITAGPLELDLAARSARANGHVLDLTAREFALLELLAMKPGATWSRTQLAERLYSEELERDSNVIDVFVARLRRKLERAGVPGAEMIRTQRGAGYRFEVPP
jgi:DNA-binding response OmpR family regulator